MLGPRASMIAYENATTGRRDYHPPVSRHHLNPPRTGRRRWPLLALILGAWLGLLGLMVLGALTR